MKGQCYTTAMFNSMRKRMYLHLSLFFTIVLGFRHCDKRHSRSVYAGLYPHCLLSFHCLNIPSMFSTQGLCTYCSFSPVIHITLSLASVSSPVKCHLFTGAFTDYLTKNKNKWTINIFLSPCFISQPYLKCNIFLYHIFIQVKYMFFEVRDTFSFPIIWLLKPRKQKVFRRRCLINKLLFGSPENRRFLEEGFW